MMRLFNIVVALTALLIFSPILLIIPILIKLDDGGAVFFSQQRLGKHKRPFTVWKFRTMQDGKITRVGKWLRITALDEFLQFLLIFLGKMSIVGPRPLTQEDVTRLGWDGSEHAKRWNTIPGITGLVQIYGGQGVQQSWELEQHYLSSQSFWLDLKIIALSAVVNFCGKKNTQNWFPLNSLKEGVGQGIVNSPKVNVIPACGNAA